MTDKNTEIDKDAALSAEPTSATDADGDVSPEAASAVHEAVAAPQHDEYPEETAKLAAPSDSKSIPNADYAQRSDPEHDASADTLPPLASSGSGGAATGVADEPPAYRKGKGILTWLLAGIALVAAIVAGFMWAQQQRLQADTTALVQQSRTSAASAEQAAGEARRAHAVAQEQASRLTEIETALAAAQEQVRDLEQAFQALTDSSSELVLINDIEHMVSIAQQQLQLNGNVANAIISLEAAQTRLARAGRPALTPLLETINGDLERLRAVSTIDVNMLSNQLAELSHLVSVAPLHMPDEASMGGRSDTPEQSEDAAGDTGAAPADQAATPQDGTQGAGQQGAQPNSQQGSQESGQEGTQPSSQTNTQASPAATPDEPWWKDSWQTVQEWSSKGWQSVTQDLGQFIAVRRVDDEAALLMSPDQASRFRENLRLRIMTAQLALMMRQEGVWQVEMDTIVKAIESRFDEQSRDARRALRIARQLSDVTVDTTLPTVDNSLRAIQTWREGQQAAPNETAPATPVQPESAPAAPDAAQTQESAQG